MSRDLDRLNLYERVRCPWCGVGVPMSGRLAHDAHGTLLQHVENMHTVKTPDPRTAEHRAWLRAQVDQHMEALRKRAEREQHDDESTP